MPVVTVLMVPWLHVSEVTVWRGKWFVSTESQVGRAVLGTLLAPKTEPATPRCKQEFECQ
jgi:hypothetical protein